MTGRRGRGLVGVLFVAVLLWGCGAADSGSISDTSPPSVSFTSPANAATGVAVNAAIGIVFSEPVDASSVNQAGMILRGPSNDIAGTINVSGTTVTFAPSQMLAYQTTYTATIAAGMKDVAGNALAAEYSWSFTTGPAPDSTAPTVSLTSPAHNASGTAVNGALSAAFSEPMDPATLTIATFFLTGPAGAVTGTVNASGTTATFTPLAGLAYNTAYTATITVAVNDLAGNALAADYTWSFTTGPAPDTTAPTVSLTTPSNNATGLPINSAIGIAFSEAMDPGTLTTATFTLIGPAGGVPGTVNANGTSAIFTPLASLAYNTAYTATLTTGAKDLAGNPLAVDYPWSFTTGPAPDTTAPIVNLTTPPNDATEIPINSVIGVAFSEAMDPSTLTTGDFTLTGPAGVVAGTVNFSGTTSTFTPLTILAYNTTYTATITTAAKDLAGNALAATYIWNFTSQDTARTWGAPELIGSDAGWYDRPQVAMDSKGNAIVVWSTSSHSIYANRYQVGMGWGSPTLIGNDSGESYSPRVAVNSSGDAVVVWSQFFGGYYNIYANRYRIDVGWGSPVPIETGLGNSFGPQVGMDDNGNVVVAWSRYPYGYGNGDIYANNYVARTDSWGVATLLASSAGAPQAVMDITGKLTVIWIRHEFLSALSNIYSISYVVGSDTWDTATLLTTIPSNAESTQVVVDGNGNMVVGWRQYDGRDGYIYATRYRDGIGWEDALFIGPAPLAENSFRIAMDSDGNSIAVWNQYNGVYYTLYAARYAISARSWGAANLIRSNSVSAFDFRLSMDRSGNAIVVWSEPVEFQTRIYAIRYDARTDTWGSVALIDNGINNGRQVELAMDSGGDAVAVWIQDGISANRFSPTPTYHIDWPVVPGTPEVTHPPTTGGPITVVP